MLYSANVPGGFRCAGLFSRTKRNRNTKRAGVQTSPCGCNSRDTKQRPDASDERRGTFPQAQGEVLAREASPEFSPHARTRADGRLPDSAPADFQNTAKTREKTPLSDNVCKRRFGC